MAEEEAAASHVAIKLPAFWQKNPRTWFVAVEAQFQRAKITQEETRYYHVLSVLPCEVIDTIFSVTEDPGDTPYTTLKEKLLGSFTPSTHQAIWQVLDMPMLADDQKPSALLDSMLAILPKEVKTTCPVIHAIYLRKLPSFLRAPLMAVKFDTIQTMAQQADMIWGGQDGQAQGHVSAARHQESRSPVRSRGRSRRPAKQRTATPAPPGDLCFYHSRFGKKAHRCEKPCTWEEAGNALAADDIDI